jgi:hypothetical protein
VVTSDDSLPLARTEWRGAVRIMRSVFPPIDLFEDTADPAGPLLISAEQRTDPQIVATLGNLDLVPPKRRSGGVGASYLLAPFAPVSTDRPSRFTHGGYGVLYAGDVFDTALFETIHHLARFRARTDELARQLRGVTASGVRAQSRRLQRADHSERRASWQ